MTGRIWAIALNTFREAVRDRVLYGLLGIAIANLLFTMALAELSYGEGRRIITDVGLAAISLFTVVVAVFLGSSLLYKEIEKKTLYVILPRPIRRWEFLLGKYGGIVLTGVVFIATMGAMQLWVMSLAAGIGAGLVWGSLVGVVAVLVVALIRARDRTAVLVPWSVFALAAMSGLSAAGDVDLLLVLSALELIACELLVLAAVALVFSSFSTPFLTGAFTIGVWLVGRSAQEMAQMQSDVIPDSIKAALALLAYVVPNFNLFVPDRSALTNMIETQGNTFVYLAETSGYALAYAAALLAAAVIIFRRRDFI